MVRTEARQKHLKPTIVWFRQDLRVQDHPALAAALEGDSAVLPVYIWSPDEEGDWKPGTPTRWWLRRSLESLRAQLRSLGSDLVLLEGPTLQAIDRLRSRTRADTVMWNRRYEPAAVKLETRLEAHLAAKGAHGRGFEGTLLTADVIRSRSGEPFRRFTPFYRAFLAEAGVDTPLRTPQRIPGGDWHGLGDEPSSLLDAIAPPDERWSAGGRWKPGTAGGLQLLKRFLSDGVSGYVEGHDLMGHAGTSSVSPHLKFGEVSVREVWHRTLGLGTSPGAQAFLRQLVWREFAYSQLRQFPHIVDTSLDERFESLATGRDDEAFAAWREGRTGYPLVDAGMRELLETGWMHNRARMVTASFLIKHLGVPWLDGARWFWNTLVDADLANNSMNWQWVAGSGIDAAPFFRIFNPTRQGLRFDPDGAYVRRWVPELAHIAGGAIHQPWKDGSRTGRYPAPIVDHETARKAALESYARIRSRKRISQP